MDAENPMAKERCKRVKVKLRPLEREKGSKDRVALWGRVKRVRGLLLQATYAVWVGCEGKALMP
jgi:hypothetical protein